MAAPQLLEKTRSPESAQLVTSDPTSPEEAGALFPHREIVGGGLRGLRSSSHGNLLDHTWSLERLVLEAELLVHTLLPDNTHLPPGVNAPRVEITAAQVLHKGSERGRLIMRAGRTRPCGVSSHITLMLRNTLVDMSSTTMALFPTYKP
ncbi:hypothetical protein INR49_022006 [Caranx melampygus]|nr:hypothetical protein INR49_022006 [Caranx melampygus]